MNTNIFIPKRINVGYQNRRDTYTKKLAYIIYYDEKGKLRKEASWNNWRDKLIPNNEFDNIPTEGFVLNQHVGGYKSSWDYRQSYCRVFDPRGFEFEITIDNLLYILDFCDCSSKMLSGQFVYAWDGTELVLLPVNAPEYNDIKEFTEKVINSNLKDKDLIVGAEYLTKDNKKWVYLGKYNYFDSGYMYIDGNGNLIKTKNKNDVPYEPGSNYNRHIDHVYRKIEYGKYQIFAYSWKDSNGKTQYGFEAYRRLPSKIIECTNSNKTSKLDDMLKELNNWEHFSPLDDTKTEIISYSYDEFKKILEQNKRFEYDDLHHNGILSKSGFPYRLSYDKNRNLWKVSMYYDRSNCILRESGLREGKDVELHFKDFQKRFNGSKVKREPSLYELHSTFDVRYYDYSCNLFNDEELFKRLEPSYAIMYLESGREYERRGFFRIKS